MSKIRLRTPLTYMVLEGPLLDSSHQRYIEHMISKYLNSGYVLVGGPHHYMDSKGRPAIAQAIYNKSVRNS